MLLAQKSDIQIAYNYFFTEQKIIADLPVLLRCLSIDFGEGIGQFEVFAKKVVWRSFLNPLLLTYEYHIINIIIKL